MSETEYEWEREKRNATSQGFTTGSLLFVLFLAMKLTEKCSFWDGHFPRFLQSTDAWWDGWFMVFLPLWVGLPIVLAVLVVVLIITLIK